MGETAQTPMKGAVSEAINEQIKHEFESAYIYLSMAASFEEASLPGMARWMRHQSEEELEHGKKFMNFLLDRGEHVRLLGIDQPPDSFRTPLDAFEQALEHEKFITGRIHELYELAVRENDYPAQVLLQWFIEEQVEEEQMTSEIVDRLRLAGDDGSAILLLDRELGERGE
ncbi:ferritin [Rubrobacter taiwanensis]|jgi:ferritin|uniref:Ferritin n=1 Tax=Rubrobacter taiwanensis TaxID=185139 RepID=A0A4R1BT88_9ACTN|nr:ferritin [Rubrobacter taiwanensis]TCJ20465.1 ferritin [Rubrobacter taiwanensis]